MPSFIPSLANEQTENNIEKDSVPTSENQINLFDDTLKKKDEKITELQASLKNLDELKTKVENKNIEISRLKKELDRIAYLNNSQTNQISSLKNELENSLKPNNAQENEIIRLRNELDQIKVSKQTQENEINRLKNDLDQALNSIQARKLEEIEESSFFEPNNGEKLGRVESCPDNMIFVSKGFFWSGQEGKLRNIANQSFCIDRTEVTQEKYKLKMGVNPSYNNGKNNPVESVSWFQAQQYCKSLNKRLPTEKEWEKAARSGSTTKYYWGNKINSLYLWYSHNSSYKSHPVALKKPNDLGLSDMLGNVYEWTDSWYSKDKKFRVLRGGSWANRQNSVRISYRDIAGPSEKGSDIGFRCVK